MGTLKAGSLVNVERSHRIGDENGGHSLYGHVEGQACIVGYKRVGRSVRTSIQVPPQSVPYIFRKGFIGVHGCSLTIDDIDEATGVFHVNLIPETLRLTTLGKMRIGSFLNYEIDQTTRTIVDTLTRTLGGYVLGANTTATTASVWPPISP